MKYQFQPIGHIKTPYNTIDECPRNINEDAVPCHILVKEEYIDGLFGLNAGDSILVLYWMDKATFSKLTLPSRKTGEIKGIFALRTPQRPNPIGAAVVTIEDIIEGEIIVRGLDCLNMTPLLDIKPAMK